MHKDFWHNGQLASSLSVSSVKEKFRIRVARERKKMHLVSQHNVRKHERKWEKETQRSRKRENMKDKIHLELTGKLSMELEYEQKTNKNKTKKKISEKIILIHVRAWLIWNQYHYQLPIFDDLKKTTFCSSDSSADIFL